VKDGIGVVTHCAGHRYDIRVEPGKPVTQWGDGSPITRAEFDSILSPTGHFEVEENQSAADDGDNKE
jgi:hypothetical protein